MSWREATNWDWGEATSATPDSTGAKELLTQLEEALVVEHRRHDSAFFVQGVLTRFIAREPSESLVDALRRGNPRVPHQYLIVLVEADNSSAVNAKALAEVNGHRLLATVWRDGTTWKCARGNADSWPGSDGKSSYMRLVETLGRS